MIDPGMYNYSLWPKGYAETSGRPVENEVIRTIMRVRILELQQ